MAADCRVELPAHFANPLPAVHKGRLGGGKALSRCQCPCKVIGVDAQLQSGTGLTAFGGQREVAAVGLNH